MSNREIKTIYEDHTFRMVAEVVDEVMFVHCYVDEYNKTVKKNITAVFEEVKRAAQFFGWDAVHTYTDNPKFASLFEGGFKIKSFTFNETDYEVWRWELE